MKKSIWILFVLLISISVSMLALAEDYALGVNRIKNPSFENGFANWTNWVGNYEVTTQTYHHGTHCVRLWTNATGANEQLLQTVKVEPGKTYDFSMWVRVPSGQSVEATLQLSNAAGGVINDLTSATLTYQAADRDDDFTPNKVNGSSGDGHTVWKEIARTVTIPLASTFTGYDAEDISTYPNICVYIRYASGGNWNRYLYIDDLSLKEQITNIDGEIVFYQDGDNIETYGYYDGTVRVVANMKYAEYKGKPLTLYVCVYDGNNMLRRVFAHAVNEADVFGRVNTVTELEMTIADYDANCRLEAFVWSDENTMKSFSTNYIQLRERQPQ